MRAVVEMIKRFKRKLKQILRPEVVIDYIDAPVMRGEVAHIPTGDTITMAPNFIPVRADAAIEAIKIGEAEVTGMHGWIRQRGIWLMQFSWYGGQSFLPLCYQVPPRKPSPAENMRDLEGNVVTTVPCFDTVYGHVLKDELPFLLHLLHDETFKLYDVILCSRLAMKLIQRVSHPNLASFMDRMQGADRQTIYRVQSLTAMRRSGCKSNPSRSELDLLRNAAEPHETTGTFPKRVFLVRESETRQIENMQAVSEVLERFEVAMVSPGEHANPWSLFANADLVIGVAGSDMEDSAFMAPGATLFEIHPSDHVKTYNWNISRLLDLNYHSIIAPSTVQRTTFVGPGNSPITVPIQTFAAELEKAVKLS